MTGTTRRRPAVSVLLISWNTRDETEACLRTLADEIATGVHCEVIVVDNGSRDGSPEMLAEQPGIILIRNSANVGFAAAVNQAYRLANAGLVLLLNSDVRLHPGSLRRMVAYLKRNPDAGGVSPLYLGPDGAFQQQYVQLPTLTAAMTLFTMLGKLPGFRGSLHRFQMRGEDFSQPRPLASGSCVLMRRSILPISEIFDESFPIYWNDAVLARRLQSEGHTLWMIPDAVVTHTRGASCRRLGPALRFRHLLGGLVNYLKLTRPGYAVTAFRAVVVANYLLRTVLGRTTVLGAADLRAALRGDVGPLPDGDVRDLVILIGHNAWLFGRIAAESASNAAVSNTAVSNTSVSNTSVSNTAAERRTVVVRVDDPAPGWRLIVRRDTDRGTELRLPLPVSVGTRLTLVRWINARYGAAQLRRWLDRVAGARLLYTDSGHQRFSVWLGEDVVEVPAPAAPVGPASAVGDVAGAGLVPRGPDRASGSQVNRGQSTGATSTGATSTIRSGQTG